MTQPSDRVVIARGPHGDLARVAERLAALGIEATIGCPEEAGCGTCRPTFWLEVAVDDAGASLEAIEHDWLGGLSPEQVEASRAAAAIVVDHEAEENTCPACLTRFAGAASVCPDCGLFLG